ncbi:MAG: siderophore-interacting protein [Myxococcota bacterium]
MSMIQGVKRGMARAMGTPVQVKAVRALSPAVREIVFQGDKLVGTAFSAGDKVKLGVAKVLRSYTPSRLDPVSGELAIVFVLHGQGPAAQWAESAAPGDPAIVLGPAPSVKAASGAPWGLFFGDATTLGLARALEDSLGTPLQGAIELPTTDLGSIEALGLQLAAVPQATDVGTALLAWAETCALPDGDGAIWVSGHAASVLAIRDVLVRRGVAKSAIRVKPYWSDRGTAHRKQVAATLAG